jgi:hypothetical protein
MRAVGVFLATAALLLVLVAWAAKHPLKYDQPDVTRSNAWGRLFWLGAGLTAILFLPHRRLGRWMAPGLMLLGLGDLLTHAPRQNPTLPVKLADFPVGLFAPGFWEIAQRQPPPRPGEGRIFITAEAEQALLYARSGDLRERWMERRTAQWSHLNLLERIPKVNGSSTLQIREQRAVEDLFYQIHTNQPPAPLLDFLGVTHQTQPGLVNVFIRRPTARLWVTAGQRPEFLPEPELLKCLAAENFDPAAVVYFPEELRGQVTVTQAAPARVNVLETRTHQWTLEVESPAPALVVIAQSFYPSWQARVDGQKTPLWRANHAFQALAVPAGKHRVEIHYVDRWFYAGLALSGFSLLAMAAIACRRSPPS